VGNTYPEIDDAIRTFIENQHVFFVASAPLDRNGHVNLSPKGLDSLRILGPTTVAYMDLHGSGIETIAHAKENGRITLMFCAFDGAPKILRLYGCSRYINPQDSAFETLRSHFPHYENPRALIVVEVNRIADSCGYGVPLLRYVGQPSSCWSGPEAVGRRG
jgi:hypothetical protein